MAILDKGQFSGKGNRLGGEGEGFNFEQRSGRREKGEEWDKKKVMSRRALFKFPEKGEKKQRGKKKTSWGERRASFYCPEGGRGADRERRKSSEPKVRFFRERGCATTGG